MIRSFRCKETKKIFELEASSAFPADILKIARRKLKMLHRSVSIVDLKIPLANRLEKLKGDLQGKWSIRVNDKWRICFKWIGTDAYEVEIVDYH